MMHNSMHKSLPLGLITAYILLISAAIVFGLPCLLCAQQEAVQQEPTKQDSIVSQGDKQASSQGSAEGRAEEVKKELTVPVPVLEIKRLEAEKPLYSIELRNVELADLFRVIAHDYNLNILVDKDVSGKITASFSNISLEEALEGIAEMSNLALQKKGNLIRVSPDLLTKSFVLKHVEANKILGISQAATTQAVQTAVGAAAGAQVATQASTIYNLLSEKGKILLGRQPNSVIVMDYPPNVKKIEDYLQAIDHRMASRVFKLKFLKANEIAGVAASSSASGGTATSSSASGGTATSSGNATSSGSGG